MVFINNRRKGFSLAEMMIVFVIVSIMLAAFAPILTKKAPRSSDPDCINGIKTVDIVYSDPGSHSFTPPNGIIDGVEVTLVGGGGGGAGGSEATNNLVCTDSVTTGCSTISFGTYAFPAKMYATLTNAGTASTCTPATPVAVGGTSGSSVVNHYIDANKSLSYVLGAGTLKTGGSDVIAAGNYTAGTAGNTINGVGTAFGGAPNTFLPCTGQSCGSGGSVNLVYESSAYACRGTVAPGNAGGRLVYSAMTPGTGGGGAAAAFFKENDFAIATPYTFTVGAGGAGGNPAQAGQDGQNTSFTINSTNHVAGGGKGGLTISSSASSVDVSSLGGTCTGPSCTAGSVPTMQTNLLKSWNGGANTAFNNGSTTFSGGLGACNGANTLNACGQINGYNGTDYKKTILSNIETIGGTGGGGGSCNNSGCGNGGAGGNGYVRLKYQMACD